MGIATGQSRAGSMRRTTASANAHISKNARTSADTKNEMTSKRYKSSLRLLAIIFLTFVMSVAIVEVLMHLA